MKEKVRQSNFELMRLISMFFIVLYHMIIITGGDLIHHTSGMTNVILDFISLFIIVHVNSFILITGYFQCKQEFSFKKIVSLIGMAWFYKVIIALIFAITGAHKFTLTEIVTILSPLEFANNWFLIVYMSLYLVSPYINIMLNKLNQKEHRKLIILLFIMFSILPTVTNQNTFSNTGFTLTHFVFLYIVGAYLNKYPISSNIHFKNYSQKKKAFLFLGIFMFFGLFNFLLYEFCESLLIINDSHFLSYICNVIIDNLFMYQNPTLIIQSIAYFLFFETIIFKNKLINKLALGTFAVYIITENPYIRDWLYPFLGINNYTSYDRSIIGKILIYSFIILVLCLIIEWVRRFITKLWKVIINHKKTNSYEEYKVKEIKKITKKV